MILSTNRVAQSIDYQRVSLDRAELLPVCFLKSTIACRYTPLPIDQLGLLAERVEQTSGEWGHRAKPPFSPSLRGMYRTCQQQRGFIWKLTLHFPHDNLPAIQSFFAHQTKSLTLIVAGVRWQSMGMSKWRNKELYNAHVHFAFLFLLLLFFSQLLRSPAKWPEQRAP